MTVPSAGDAEVRIVPDFSEFSGEVAHGIEAALQVAKNEVRNAFAAMFRAVLDKGVFEPMKKQAIPFVSGVGADLAQSFTNSFVRGMIDQMPGKVGRAFSSALMQGGESAAESGGAQLATKVADAFSKPLGQKLGDAAAKGLIGLYKAWTKASDFVSDLWAVTVNKLMDTGILGAVKKAGTAVGNALMSAWKSSIEKIKDWGSTVLPKVRELGGKIVAGLQEAWTKIRPAFQSAIDRLRDVGSELLPKMRAFGERIVTALQERWTQIRPAFSAAIDKLKDIGSQVIPIGKMVGERVLEGLKLAWTTFRPYAQQFISGLTDSFSGLGSALRQLGSSMASRIATAFQAASRDVATPAMQAVSQGMQREGGRVAQVTGQVGEQAAGTLKQGFSRFLRGGAIGPEDLFRGGSQGYQSGLGNLGQMFGRRFATETGVGVNAQAATAAHQAALNRTWHPGAVDTAIINATRAAGQFVVTVGEWIGRGISLVARPAAKMAKAIGEPFYNVTSDTIGVIGNLLIRVLPEKWRDGAFRAVTTFRNTIGPPVMTAIGMAAGAALVYGLAKGSKAVASFVADVYMVISKGLLKVGELGLQAGIAIVKGLGSALAGVAQVTANAVGLIGKGLAEAGRLVANVAGTMTAAVAGVGAAAVKAGMSYNVLSQRSMAAFRTILGSGEAATKMMADIKEFASTSPFPRQNFIEAAQLMTSFGIEANKVIPYLDGIQNATAAMGMSADKINEITYVLAQIQAAGKITATDLMQLGQRGINAAELIGSQMGKTGTEIKEQITAGTLDATEALDALIAGMSDRFAGAAEGVKETWVGATDRIKGALRDIGSDLVEPFIGKEGGGMAVAWANQLADLLRALQKLIQPLAQAFIDKMTPQLAKITPMLTGITERLGKLDLSKLMDGFSTLGPLIGAAGTALTIFAGKNLFSGIPIIGDFVGKLNPLVGGLFALVAMSPELQQGIGAVVSGPLKQMGSMFGQFMPLFEKLSTILSDTLMTAIRALMPVVLAVVEQIAKLAPVLVDTLGAVANAFGPMARTIGNVLANVFNAFGPAISSILTAVSQLAGPVGRMIGVIAQTFGQLLSSLGPAFSRIVEVIASAMSELLPKIMPVIRQIGGLLVGLVRGVTPILTTLVPILADIFAALIPIIRPIIDTLGQVFAAIMPAIQTVVRALGTALVGALKAIQPSLAVILPLIAEMAQTFFPMLARIIERLAPVIPLIAEAFGKVAEFLFQLLADVLSSPVWEQFINLMVDLAKDLLPIMAPLVLQLLEPFKMLMPILGNLAKALFPAIKTIIEALIPILPSLVQFISGIAHMFVQLADALVPLISTLLPPIAALFELLMVAIEPILPLVGLLAQLFGPSLVTTLVRLLTPFLALISTVLTPLLKIVTAVLTPIVKVTTALTNMIGWVFGPSGAFGIAGKVMGGVMNWLGQLPGLAGRAFDPVIAIFRKLSSWMQPGIELIKTVVRWILGGSPGLIPAFKGLGDIVRSVMGFIGNIIKTVFTVIKNIIMGVVTVIWNVIRFYFNLIRKIITTVLKVVWFVIKLYFNIYKAIITTILRVIKAVITGIWNGIKAAFIFVFKLIRGIVMFYFNAYKKIITTVFRIIRNIITTVWNVIKTVLQTVFRRVIKPIFDAFGKAIEVLGGVFRWLWDKVFDPIWGFIKRAFRVGLSVVEPILNTFKTVINAVKDAFRKMWEGIKWAWGKIAGFLKRVWDNTIGKVMGFFRDMPDKVKAAFEKMRDALSDIMEKVKNFIKRPIVFVIDKIIGTLLRGINTLLRAVHIPEIPLGWIDAVKGMQEGGRVPGGWGGGDRVPLLAEPGEWVLTKRQAKALGYGNLHNLPRYAEGGMIGSNVHPGYFDNGPDIGLGPSARWGLPSWANPVEWGKGVVKLGKGVWELGKDIFNEAVGLLRYAAYKAFEVLTKPLLKMAKSFADDEDANIMKRIMGGLMVSAIEGARDFIRGKSEDAPEPEAVGLASAVIEAAKSRLGMPYVWAAKGPTSFDCSGLVQWSYAKAGIPGIGPNTGEQITKGRQVKRPLNPADLIFWGSPVYHVALALGGNRLIEAPQAGQNVSIRDIYGNPSQYRRIIDEAAMPTTGGKGVWGPIVERALQLAGYRGSTSDAVGGILAILMPESGGNPRAMNDYDINWRKGIPSVGLMQMIPPNLRAYRVPGTSRDATPTSLIGVQGNAFTVPAWMVDPLANVAAAIRYMQRRYGGVMSALRFRQQHNWYDQGGWLPPGVTTVLNATGRPEPVLSPRQWEAISANRGGVDVVEVEVERGPMRLAGGTLSITPDSAGGLRAWIQDMVLDEADLDGTYARMGGGNW